MKVILNDLMYNDKEIFSKRPHLQHNFKVPKSHITPQSMHPALQIPIFFLLFFYFFYFSIISSIFASIIKCMHFQSVLG